MSGHPLSSREHATLLELEHALDRTPGLRGHRGRSCRRAAGVLGRAGVVVLVLVGLAALLGEPGFAIGTLGAAATIITAVLLDLWRAGSERTASRHAGPGDPDPGHQGPR